MAELLNSILYVDDEPQNLVAFKASFRRYYHVLTAQSGDEALLLMQDQPVDLVISDHRMPKMTGVQLLEKIREGYPDTVRMILTGYSDLQSIISAINKGRIYHYITKPWDQTELKVIIDNALESLRLKRENRNLIAEKNELLLRAERQEKAQILSKLESLKHQVNPHFLFNSLNVLSSLVHENAALAEEFIVKLTRVYRYVLDMRGEDLVRLSDEINFIHSYVFLHRIRFGDSLTLKVDVAPDYLEKMVPTLTLQLLVENAVKHNIISRSEPLHIEILQQPDDWLLVRNNLQPRRDHVESTGIGLPNLLARYGFLSDRTPEFGPDGNTYTARIPLLSPD